MDKIDRMRAFAAVARENSFAAAARRLGLSARLVSKYVADLEGSLDARLLNRTTRSVSLTDVGAAYLAQCEPLLDGFDELEETVRDRQTKLRGLIRLTAPTGFGATRLADALSRFIERNPLVQLELKLSDQHVAIVDEGIDLAIRIGVMRDSSLIARRLTPMPLLVVAAPAYLARRGAPDHPRALATHECVTHSEDPDADLWRFAIGEREEAVRVGGAIKGNSPAVAARFAIAGLAIARCPAYTVDDALADGRLVELFAEARPPVYSVFVLYPPNRRLTTRVRALIDHLAADPSLTSPRLADARGAG